MSIFIVIPIHYNFIFKKGLFTQEIFSKHLLCIRPIVGTKDTMNRYGSCPQKAYQFMSLEMYTFNFNVNSPAPRLKFF